MENARIEELSYQKRKSSSVDEGKVKKRRCLIEEKKTKSEVSARSIPFYQKRKQRGTMPSGTSAPLDCGPK